jgi:molecular chaperone GrpE (heat shock protein)
MNRLSLRARLAAAWHALRGAAPSAPIPVFQPADDARLTAEAEAARLRLELEETRQRLAALRRDLEAEKAGRADAVQTALAARLEPVLGDAASLLGQLALQSRLLDEGKPVGPRDVMALAQGLAQAFERLGLTPLAMMGETVAFDPAQHDPLTGPAPKPGQPVVVRIPGYRLGPQLLSKSFVELQP